MKIYKIEKPQDGWKQKDLELKGFSFNYCEINRQKNLVFIILNKNLPYFYYVLTEQEELREHHNIFINKEFVDLVHKASVRNQFNQDLLSSITNFGIIQSEDDIVPIINKRIELYKQWLEKDKQRQKELAIQEQKIQKQKEERERRKKENYLKSQQKKDFEYTEDNGPGGIYGIYSIDANNDRQLLYIGLTTRPFAERWDEHKDIVNFEADVPKGMERVYSLLRDEHDRKVLECKELVSFSKLCTNRLITKSEKEAMELAMINYFHPPGNASGITVPYYFSDTKTQYEI